ncbi:MAG: ATP-binding cassette domain-containing protein, partial [bacterium]|nr:ATP-binding cassette domain-containing protein [bacterium]
MGVLLNTVSFGYNELLLNNVTCHFDKGWTGVTGVNGAGKTTVLLLALGYLEPDRGKISREGEGIYCSQRTDVLPEEFEDFIYSYTGTAQKLKGKLNIEDDWLYRWETLSYGERKRAQIGTALWQEPEVLAIDEPTN